MRCYIASGRVIALERYLDPSISLEDSITHVETGKILTMELDFKRLSSIVAGKGWEVRFLGCAFRKGNLFAESDSEN